MTLKSQQKMLVFFWADSLKRECSQLSVFILEHCFDQLVAGSTCTAEF